MNLCLTILRVGPEGNESNCETDDWLHRNDAYTMNTATNLTQGHVGIGTNTQLIGSANETQGQNKLRHICVMIFINCTTISVIDLIIIFWETDVLGCITQQIMGIQV